MQFYTQGFDIDSNFSNITIPIIVGLKLETPKYNIYNQVGYKDIVIYKHMLTYTEIYQHILAHNIYIY